MPSVTGAREVAMSRVATHRAKECKVPPRCLTCTDRGDKDVAHVAQPSVSG